jgi:hypothetical protein
MRGHVEMHDPPSVVSQNQEYVQDLKPDRRHGKEVDRNHGLDVVLKERPPGLRRWLAVAYDVLAHAGLTDVDAKFQQFAVDAGRAPKADSRGSSSESVGEPLSTPLGARVGRDELSMSRTDGSPCGASQ